MARRQQLPYAGQLVYRSYRVKLLFADGRAGVFQREVEVYDLLRGDVPQRRKAPPVVNRLRLLARLFRGSLRRKAGPALLLHQLLADVLAAPAPVMHRDEAGPEQAQVKPHLQYVSTHDPVAALTTYNYFIHCASLPAGHRARGRSRN